MIRQRLQTLTKVVLMCLISFFMVGTGIVSAQYYQVPTAAIAINGKAVDGINPMFVNGTYYLPFVKLSHILGYNDIQFESQTSTYEVTDGSITVRATRGGTLARRGDEYIHIDPLLWINQTAYVSLHAGGALFNTNIDFRAEDGSIQVQKPALTYVVEKDDTLWQIAQAHHTTVQDIKNVNQLRSNLIFVGQTLRIPPREKTREQQPINEHEPVGRTGTITPIDEQRQNIINSAKKYRGGTYKFGAKLHEAPTYIDCSSFTKLVYRENGIEIPRSSRDQAKKGRYVKDTLQPGDLMFFTWQELYSDGRVGHVGIYLGNGDMIHATTRKGVTITENVFDSSYWSKNYLYSKRIIE